jgi:hypothetical protein
MMVPLGPVGRVSLRRVFPLVLLTCWVACHVVTAHAGGTVTNASFQELYDRVRTGGTVTFATNVAITFTGTLVISNNTVIDGGNNTITLSGNNAVRLFEVRSNVSLTLQKLTLTGGNVSGANGGDGGDGDDEINVGGNGRKGTNGVEAFGAGIYNLGNLTVMNSRLTANIAKGGNGGDGGDGGSGDFEGGDGGNGGSGGRAYGSAIYSVGTLLLTNCTISGISATGGNGGDGGAAGGGGFPGQAGNGAPGAAAFGVGICSFGTARIFNSTFSGNTATGGDSTKAGPESGGSFGLDGDAGGSSQGGGIYNTGILTVVNCTFASNTLRGGKGGDGGDGDYQGGDGGNGGLASGGGVYSAGAATISNCTFSVNSASGGTNGVGGAGGFSPGSDGSRGQSRGGNIARSGGSLVLANSIIAGAVSGGNGHGTIIDAGHNVSSDNSVNMTNAGSVKNVNAKLSVLGDYGGPTQTIVPQTGSPAIDRGATGGCLPIDQRGFPRYVGTNCDSGSVEASSFTIVTQPQSQTNTIGSPVSFNVVAAGESPLTYQWRFNNTNIVGATNVTLAFAAVDLTNAGNYRVVVFSPSGSITSTVATLTVLSFSVQAQPQSQTNTVGSTVSFSIAVDSELPTTYQWRFNGTNVAGATNSTLMLDNVQLTNSGDYQVVVSNASGMLPSSIAVLVVVVPVTIDSSGLLFDTNFFIIFQSVPGQIYVLEYKDGLSDSNWIPLETNVGDGNLFTNLSPITGTTSRFFRLLIE